MPSQLMSDNQDLELDLQALRYLLMRPAYAQALWSSDSKKRLLSIIPQLYGDANTETIVAVIADQVLSTYLIAMANMLQSSSQKNRPLRARDIMTLLSKTIALQEDTPVVYKHRIRFTLLKVAIYASLHLLMQVDSHTVSEEYRTLIDFIRSNFSDTNVTRINTTRNQGISSIKKVTTSLFKKRLSTASVQLSQFINRNSPSDLIQQLRACAEEILNSLSPLHIPSLFDLLATKTSNKRAAEKKKRSKRKQIEPIASVPDFFSDAGPQSEPPEPSGSEYRTHQDHPGSGIETSDEEQSSRQHADFQDDDSIQENPRHTRTSKQRRRVADNKREQPQRKRRKNSDSNDDDDLDYEPGSHDIMEAIDDMQSVDFSGSESDKETENHSQVVKQAHSRRTKHRARPAPRSRHNTVEREISNHLTRREAASAEASDAPEDEGNSTDLEDAIHRQTSRVGGRTMKELYESVQNMDENGGPDPLAAAVAAAARARSRRQSGGHETRVPARRKRAVSPIPDSFDDSPMPRKSRRNIQLRDELSSSPSPRRGRRGQSSRRGSAVRTGRFQPFEDELLIKGLQKYGWAQWSLISENFGTGSTTRTAMSLKDRARTLNLDPTQYPLPSGAKKRGRPREYHQRTPSSHEDIDEIDDDEILDQGNANEHK